MKIGILTLPLHTNYGGILQAYALQVYLKNRGHEVVLIDRRWNKSNLGKLKYFLKFKKRSDYNIIASNTAKFIQREISPKTKSIYSESKLKKIVTQENFDLIVVGSDQVWRLEYTKEFSDNFFLNFIESRDIKKVSYAASFGEDTWDQPQEITRKISKLLNKFDFISVREDSALKLCADNFDLKAEHHVDPTMLLSDKQYMSLLENREQKPKKDILVYMLDINGDRKKAIEKICKTLNSEPIYINVKSKNPQDKIKDRIYPPVSNWLKGFRDCKFVITDSFHGSVFSIIFNKPFIAYGNKRRGLTRFYSVLKMFALENRLVLQNEDINDALIEDKIDWEKVNKVLNIQRSRTDAYFNKIEL